MDHTASVTNSLRDHLFNGFAAFERDEGLCAYKHALLNYANRLIAGDSCRFPSGVIGNHIPQFVKLFASKATNASDSRAQSPTISSDASSLQIVAERVIEDVDIVRIEVDVFNACRSAIFYDLELMIYSDSISISCESSPCLQLPSSSKTTLSNVIHRSSLPLTPATIKASLVVSYCINQDCEETQHLPGRSVLFRRWWSSDSTSERHNSVSGIRKEYSVRAGLCLSSESQNLLTLPSFLRETLNFVNFESIDSGSLSTEESRAVLCSRSDVQVEIRSLTRCDAQIMISSFCQNRICSALGEILSCYPEGRLSVSIDWSAPCYFQWTVNLAGSLRSELQQTEALLHQITSKLIAHGGARAPDHLFAELQNEFQDRTSQLRQLQSTSDLLAGRVLAICGAGNDLG